MSEILPDHKLLTAHEMYDVMKHIMAGRRVSAGQSQYDVMVCVRSVDAAIRLLECMPIEGAARDYGYAVAAALGSMCDTYNDPDGEYTSKGNLGDVCSDISRLLKSQDSSERTDIDRGEVHEILMLEMNNLAQLTPQPPTGLGVATIKTVAMGADGAQYWVKMTVQETLNARFAILGAIYSHELCCFPVLEERLEFGLRSDS